MTETLLAPDPLAIDPMRQHLDELHDLIERMLELPVVDADGAPIPAAPAAVESLLSTEFGVAADSWLVTHAPPALEASDESWSSFELLAPAPQAAPPATDVPRRPSENVARNVEADDRGRAWPAPFVWPNRIFDALAGRLGRPGRWLMGPVGRNVLAALGVLMLGVSIFGSALEWLGWTR